MKALSELAATHSEQSIVGKAGRSNYICSLSLSAECCRTIKGHSGLRPSLYWPGSAYSVGIFGNCSAKVCFWIEEVWFHCNYNKTKFS
jgi:hypothetical protein